MSKYFSYSAWNQVLSRFDMENHVKFIFHSALQPSFEPP